MKEQCLCLLDSKKDDEVAVPVGAQEHERYYPAPPHPTGNWSWKSSACVCWTARKIMTLTTPTPSSEGSVCRTETPLCAQVSQNPVCATESILCAQVSRNPVGTLVGFLGRFWGYWSWYLCWRCLCLKRSMHMFHLGIQCKFMYVIRKYIQMTY